MQKRKPRRWLLHLPAPRFSSCQPEGFPPESLNPVKVTPTPTPASPGWNGRLSPVTPQGRALVTATGKQAIRKETHSRKTRCRKHKDGEKVVEETAQKVEGKGEDRQLESHTAQRVNTCLGPTEDRTREEVGRHSREQQPPGLLCPADSRQRAEEGGLRRDTGPKSQQHV